jgi:hypothetical protein
MLIRWPTNKKTSLVASCGASTWYTFSKRSEAGKKAREVMDEACVNSLVKKASIEYQKISSDIEDYIQKYEASSKEKSQNLSVPVGGYAGSNGSKKTNSLSLKESQCKSLGFKKDTKDYLGVPGMPCCEAVEIRCGPDRGNRDSKPTASS